VSLCPTNVDGMLDGVDLTNVPEVEGVRRSVAMLAPGANALRREDALALLDVLVDEKRADSRSTD